MATVIQRLRSRLKFTHVQQRMDAYSTIDIKRILLYIVHYYYLNHYIIMLNPDIFACFAEDGRNLSYNAYNQPRILFRISC